MNAMRKVTIIAIIIVMLFVSVDAQDDLVYPLERIEDATDITMVGCTYNPAWGASYCAYNRISVTDEQWQELTAIEAVRDIWIGYPKGWDVDEGATFDYKIDGVLYGVPVEVWIWSGGGEQYLLPFDNTTLFARDDGSYYGIHPYGGWSVDSDVLLDWIARGQDSE